MLNERDASLGELAKNAPPKSGSKKRSGGHKDSNAPSKRPRASSPVKSKKGSYESKNASAELAEREVRAMEQLREFIVDKCGGTPDMIDGFRVRVTKKKGAKLTHQAKFDINYFSPQNKRFRSMLQVGRLYNLVKDDTKANNSNGGGKNTSRLSRAAGGTKEQIAEKKKIRRELDKLRKALNRATAQLDDFGEKSKEQEAQGQQKLDDTETQEKTRVMTRRVCAATRLCDVTSFPAVPQHCIPDVLMSWDFLCTFSRQLSLQPIDLPDFCGALAYRPPMNLGSDDLTMAPPVYVVECHLSLLRLLLQDEMSKTWWKSTIETDTLSPVVEDVVMEDAGNNTEEDDEDDDTDSSPIIKVDMSSLLEEKEDPLRTTSWIKSLQEVKSKKGKAVRETIKAAIKLTGNKWVIAYLKKALDYHRSPSGGPQSTRRAVQWLINRLAEARPDLTDSSLKHEQIMQARTHAIEQCTILMGNLPSSAPIVTDEDVAAGYESEEDSEDEDDDEDDEPEEKAVNETNSKSMDEQPASAVPPRPTPSYVDLLLPNEKPTEKSEYMNPFTWAQMAGATVRRILHRRKRLINEVDDSLRAAKDLPPLTVPERREREKDIASRILTECHLNTDGNSQLVEDGIEHLCGGKQYLELTFEQRLCILRLLIEAAYDSKRVYDTVVGNYNQRASAMKLLEQEKRKAKKEAKQKASDDEAAAREKLSAEAKERFLDEKREEIRKLNEVSNEMTEEMLESLTDDDILNFDEDIKADYDALPAPESFSKNEVSKMVTRMAEEAAFDTDALTVLKLEDIVEREHLLLEEMEGQLAGFGGEDAMTDDTLDRESIRAMRSLTIDIEKTKSQAEKLPAIREKAIEQLGDAIHDGTIKVLRSAVTAAKKAKLSGPDDETGGIWALDLLRDAAVELEKAKQNKKLIDAQKDLVAKRNKCFIRTEPVGRDRFGNRFWKFSNEEEGNFWAEAEFSIKRDGDEDYVAPEGYTNVLREKCDIIVGAEDKEEDFLTPDEMMKEDECRLFCRREFHSSGFAGQLARNYWGCHTTEESLRKVIKSLDGKGSREKSMKACLKESLEKVDKQEHEVESALPSIDEEAGQNDMAESVPKTEGDEAAFAEAKKLIVDAGTTSLGKLENLTSALGQKVRVRVKVGGSRDNELARYETGTVTSWKTRPEQRELLKEDSGNVSDEEVTDAEPKVEIIHVPLWRIWTELGSVLWLEGNDLFESLARYHKSESAGYFEHDSAFLGYRNSLGRFSGKASEASFASSPVNFAKLMVKKEAELYPKLKIRSYDEFWGGSKSGQRAGWINKMKDYAFDTETVKQGLLTLEGAFFQLMGEFDEYQLLSTETPDGQAILNDPDQLQLAELESDKTVIGLWNRPESRAIYLEIVSRANTTGLLALALELLCRNTGKYLKKHGLLNTRTQQYSMEEDLVVTNTGRPRRRNAWQSSAADIDDWYE